MKGVQPEVVADFLFRNAKAVTADVSDGSSTTEPQQHRVASPSGFGRLSFIRAGLGDDIPDHVPEIHLQTFVRRDFHALGFEAELMQERGVDVGDIVGVFLGVKSNLVRGAMGNAAADAAASHPDAEPAGGPRHHRSPRTAYCQTSSRRVPHPEEERLYLNRVPTARETSLSLSSHSIPRFWSARACGTVHYCSNAAPARACGIFRSHISPAQWRSRRVPSQKN